VQTRVPDCVHEKAVQTNNAGANCQNRVTTGTTRSLGWRAADCTRGGAVGLPGGLHWPYHASRKGSVPPQVDPL